MIPEDKMDGMDNETKKSIFWGVVGGVLLLVLYFLILTLANSFSHALEQFRLWDFWFLALAGGFGTQIGLYSYIRQKIRQSQMLKTAQKEVAATASITTTSMIACCAHHLVDVLPILGLSAALLFFAQYQKFFLLLGALSNLLGIIFMLEIIKKHSLFKKTGILSKIVQLDIRKTRNWTIAGSALVLLTTFLLIRNNQIQDSFVYSKSSADNSEVLSDATTVFLPSKTNNEGGLSVEIKPINFSFNEPTLFEIVLNTHQGSLDFDLTTKSVLIDDQNNQYQPLEWQGEGGGHHLSGVLIFPNIPTKTKKITLKIFDVYGVRERDFIWELSGSFKSTF